MANQFKTEASVCWSVRESAPPSAAVLWETTGRHQRLQGLIPIDPAMGDFPAKPAVVPDLIANASRATLPAAPALQALKLSADDLRRRRGLPRRAAARLREDQARGETERAYRRIWVRPPDRTDGTGFFTGAAQRGMRRPQAERRRTPLAELWQSLQYALARHRLARVIAILILVILAGSLEYSSSGWPKLAAPSLDRPFHAAMAALQQPIKSRAAFFILEDFAGDSDAWLNTGSLKREGGGFTTAGGLALRLDTMELSNYRFDFEARIRSRAVGWVVRAADTRNYYAFKLVENGGEKPHLLRYPVIGGSRRGGGPVRIELPAELATSEFNRVTVRVRGQQITTLVNGWGVDFWKDAALPAGGIGFLSDSGESAFVRKLTVTGNDDTWGLILYGTLETLQTLEERFGSGPVAFQLQPFPAGVLAQVRR